MIRASFFLLLAMTISAGTLLAQSEAPPLSPPPTSPSTPGTDPMTTGQTPTAPVGTMPIPQAPSLMSPDGTINEEGVLFQPTDGYVYDPNNRRDPFKPFGQSQSSQAPAITPTDDTNPQAQEVPQIPPEPLQLYDVSQLKLMGIIWQVKTPKAVVKDPVGKQHIVFKFTKIGRNNGFIASIREGEIIIVEPTVTENGMPSAITRVLTLKNK